LRALGRFHRQDRLSRFQLTGLGDAMQTEEVTLFEGDWLGQGLNLGNCRLQKGCEGEIAEPIEACERLYAVVDGKAVGVIDDYSDLSAYVQQVESSVQAESFVRLLTSLETFHLFQRERIEVDCRFVERQQKSATAQIDRTEAERLGLHPMAIVETDDGYRIERCLVVWQGDSAHARLHEVTEKVGFDGAYRRLIDRPVTAWEVSSMALPVYE